MTWEELLNAGRRELEKARVPEAEINAWYLLQACLERKGLAFRKSDYFMRRQEEVSAGVEAEYWLFIAERKKRIPLEYITGYTEFMGLSFLVNQEVLIPRQDTEILVECAYPFCRGKRVLDLCTGSGCIGLSIGVFGKPSYVVLSDVSEGACRVAARNLEYIQKNHKGGIDAKVDIVCGNLWEPITKTFDVIVSNPPYIESDVIQTLMPEVRDYEPSGALDGGQDGMDFYRRILKGAPMYLTPGGMLFMEIGYNQGTQLTCMMKEAGFSDVEVKKDLAGLDRVVIGRLEESYV